MNGTERNQNFLKKIHCPYCWAKDEAKLFSIGIELEEELDRGDRGVSEKLKNEFETKRFSLPEDSIVGKEEDDKWMLTDKEKKKTYYVIRKEEGELNIYGIFKVVISHPPISQFSSKDFPEVKVPRWMFWAVKYPKGTREGSVRCKNCGREFYVGLFPYDSDDSKNSKDLNYYLKLAKGETKIIDKNFLLEDILDRFCSLFGVNYPLGCFLCILIPYILFWISPIATLGGFSKLSHDFGIHFLFILFVLMFILLKRHCKTLKEALNFDKMPILLSEQYKTSNLSKEAEQLCKGWIFGHPFQRIKTPTFCGLAAVVIFLAWQINFTVNIASTFYETPYPGGYPFVYTSYIVAISCAVLNNS